MQWALVDSGAELTLVTTQFANFANLVMPNFQNVQDSGFHIVGVNGYRSPTQVINTRITLGRSESENRTYPISLCVITGEAYKLVLGMEVLERLKAIIDVG